MTTLEGEPVGSVSDIASLGDEWGVTVYDAKDREIAAFAFHTEIDARRAAKAMQSIVADAVAVIGPE
jgi:hypothetical protein